MASGRVSRRGISDKVSDKVSDKGSDRGASCSCCGSAEKFACGATGCKQPLANASKCNSLRLVAVGVAPGVWCTGIGDLSPRRPESRCVGLMSLSVSATDNIHPVFEQNRGG